MVDDSNGERLGTHDELKNRNDRLLRESAAKKVKAGKPLTRAEVGAVAKAERERAASSETPYYSRMPKGEYVATFGGSSKVYIDWHKLHGFPWDISADHVDVLEIHRWYREVFASGGKLLAERDIAARKREAEAQVIEAEARIKQRRAERDEHRFLRIELVQSEWASFLSVLRDDIMSIPDDVKPMFPAGQADQLTAELERRLFRALTAIASRPISDFLERMSNGKSVSN